MIAKKIKEISDLLLCDDIRSIHVNCPNPCLKTSFIGQTITRFIRENKFTKIASIFFDIDSARKNSEQNLASVNHGFFCHDHMDYKFIIDPTTFENKQLSRIFRHDWDLIIIDDYDMSGSQRKHNLHDYASTHEDTKLLMVSTMVNYEADFMVEL
jgi:hypothetical protein